MPPKHETNNPPDNGISQTWRIYLRTRRDEDRNHLIEHYLPLVHIRARNLSNRLPKYITFDDLRSAGYDGLLDAVEAYKPEKKVKFETFCRKRITGAMIEWLRSQDTKSRTIHAFEKKENLQ